MEYISIVESMVAASHGKLELVMLDSTYCLRSTANRSVTLSAGCKLESKEDSCKRIVRRLLFRGKGKFKALNMSRLKEYGIPTADSAEELAIRLALVGGKYEGEA